MKIRSKIHACVTSALIVCGLTAIAHGQTSSLFRPAALGKSSDSLGNSSWLYEGVDPPRVFNLNDVITVMVIESSQANSGSTAQRARQGQLDAELANWVRLRGGNVLPGPGDSPHINGTLVSQFRGSSSVRTIDLTKYSIPMRVVDIRPNGHLLLEARQTVVGNEGTGEETSDRLLWVTVRAEDVLPNNTVLSEKVAGGVE